MLMLLQATGFLSIAQVQAVIGWRAEADRSATRFASC